jgi:predicted RNA-binding protein associated with RNAse of E/G family
MKVMIKLFVAESGTEPVYQRVLEFPDDKFELLDEDETSAALDTNVRTWAEQHLMLDWEVLKP